MIRRTIISVLVACVAVGAFARGNLKELTVPLTFIPQEGVHATNADLQPGVLKTSVDIRVEDGRKLDDPLLIGQGTGGDDKPFPVHADHSVIEYVQETVVRTGKTWGLTQTTPAARVLVLHLTRFNLDESNKALGSVYGAEVKFAYTLKDGKGAVLNEGAASGTAHRYGHAHSPENCNEVLSDALKEAFGNVLAAADLQQAWASGKRVSGAAAAAKESPEERLRKLDDLYKKGLITKEEYQQKRADILKEM
jgi:hypothetical protein